MASVVVIGAGISGIIAAKELQQKGFKVTVLQASNQIGGRLMTKQCEIAGKKYNFDLGGGWIRGSNEFNPLTNLISESTESKLIETDQQNVIVFNSKGEVIQKQANIEWLIYERMTDSMEEYSNQNDSAESALKKINAQKVSSGIFMYHISNDLEFQTGASISDLSGKYGLDDSEYQGPDQLVVSGFQNFAKEIAMKAKIQVLFHQKVNSIFYDPGTKQTLVTCATGQKLNAKYVIISVPLGILKKQQIKFFPPLPAPKNQAIKQIGFGNVCKILISLKQPITKLKEHYIGVVSDDVGQRGLFTYFLNLSELTGVPAFITFGLGCNADLAQKMPEQQAIALITKRINVFADKKITAKDITISRSHWRAYPNSYGAYSYASIITKPQDWLELARPIFENGWYFCGEHTSQKYRGSIHGAIISGTKVASTISSGLNEKNWIYNEDESLDQQEKS